MDGSIAVAPSVASSRLVVLGRAATVSGLLGVAAGVFTLAYPAAVSSDQWSYPFSTGAQWATSVVLALAHALTAAGFIGIVLADPHRRSRTGATGLWLAFAGFVALTFCELASGGIGDQSVNSTVAENVSAAFGIGSMATALGSVVAGIVIVRARVWSGLGRWMVLASGGLMIIVVTPALIIGDLWPRTLALMLWSLTFVPLGLTISSSTKP